MSHTSLYFKLVSFGIILTVILALNVCSAANQMKTPLDPSIIYSKMINDPKTSSSMKDTLKTVIEEQKKGNTVQANDLIKQAVLDEMNTLSSNKNDPRYLFMSALNSALNSNNAIELNAALWQLKNFRDSPDNKDDKSQSMALYLDAFINDKMDRPDQVRNTLAYAFKNDPTNADLFKQYETFLKEAYPDSAERELNQIKKDTGYTEPQNQNNENQISPDQSTNNQGLGEQGAGDSAG